MAWRRLDDIYNRAWEGCNTPGKGNYYCEKSLECAEGRLCLPYLQPPGLGQTLQDVTWTKGCDFPSGRSGEPCGPSGLFYPDEECVSGARCARRTHLSIGDEATATAQEQFRRGYRSNTGEKVCVTATHEELCLADGSVAEGEGCSDSASCAQGPFVFPTASTALSASYFPPPSPSLASRPEP